MINTQQLQTYIKFPNTLTSQTLNTLCKQYNESEEQSIIIQLIIQGLILKKYTHDTLQLISSMANSNQILFFVFLAILYKQKNKCNTVQQQQSINKLINIHEEHFKNIIHHIELDSVYIIKAITKCVMLNPQLFRNHQKQLQELCIHNRTIESCDLYAVLQFTYLEGKQGNNSYQSQITNTIEQLFDAYYVLSSLLDLDKDKQTLYNSWQNTLITEEFKMNLLHIEGKNTKTKYSIIFQLVKELIQNYDETQYLETMQYILNLLNSQLSFIKEDIVIDIQIDTAIQRIGDMLQLNNCFDDHLVNVYETQHIQNIMQQLQNKLNKIMIDRNITINIQQYKILNEFIKLTGLELLCILIKSSFGQGLIINTNLQQILLKFTTTSFSVNSSIILKLINLYGQMNKLNFLTTRLEIEITSRILEQLELEFPKFMKNMNVYLKSERHQIYKPNNNNKKLKPTKDIQLGFLPQDQLTKTTVKQLRIRFELQFKALSVMNQGYTHEQIKRLYQFLFLIFTFPHDLIITYLGSEVLQQLLHLCRAVLINFHEIEIYIMQPMRYFITYLEQSELYSSDLLLQDATYGLINLIDTTYTIRKSLSVDNFVSAMKSLNEQFSKAQQIYQSIASEEQYYSCKDNHMEQSLNNSNGNNINLQQVAAQIRKTHSFVGEEESSSKQNEMFYSIINPVEGKQDPAPKINTIQESKPDDEEFEMPKVVFD